MTLSREENFNGTPAPRRVELRDIRDEDLIVMVQEGKKKAFDELVARYKGRLFSFILRMVKDPTLAEELTQDAFLKAYRRLDSFRGDARFSTWLYRIVHNVGMNHLAYRQARKRSGRVAPLAGEGPPAAAVEGVEVLDEQPMGDVTQFQIRY